jgi:hypothetical protein
MSREEELEVLEDQLRRLRQAAEEVEERLKYVRERRTE